MRRILEKFSSKLGQIAVLIDPDKTNDIKSLTEVVKKAEWAGVDYLFVGGSTVNEADFGKVIETIKSFSKLPLVIFPGANNQLSSKADAILYLSLLSGRNPEYLIGQHVQNAESVLELNIEVIPTSYILIDGGKQTSVAYVSQTQPIPHHNNKIAEKTAIAGFLQGKQITFFDAGSGALASVPLKVLEHTKKVISTPILVGGGIQSKQQLVDYTNAGANVLVIGNKIEEELDFLLDVRDFIYELENKCDFSN
jgi:phosphoglycerol geranylgeranyltransferase